MSARDEMDRACKDEASHALVLHADAVDYLAGDLTPKDFLNSAYQYALARLERERLHDEMWGAA